MNGNPAAVRGFRSRNDTFNSDVLCNKLLRCHFIKSVDLKTQTKFIFKHSHKYCEQLEIVHCNQNSASVKVASRLFLYLCITAAHEAAHLPHVQVIQMPSVFLQLPDFFSDYQYQYFLQDIQMKIPISV